MKGAKDLRIDGWVLYDGSCGFCSRWVPFWKGTLERRGFHIASLQSDWVAEKLKLSQEELVADVRLLLTSGEQITGVEVYRYLMRRIWWAKPLYLLSTLPLLRSLFDCGYRAFADNRYWVSRACHLPNKDKAK